MPYTVLIHKAAKRKFEKIRENVLKQRLAEAFRLLSEPFALDTVKIAGEENSFRTRIGKYRILWALDRGEICIMDFDVRGRIYK